MTHDPKNEEICDHGMQCYSIMKERGEFCHNCLKWSDQSIEEIKKYATYIKYKSISTFLIFLFTYFMNKRDLFILGKIEIIVIF